MSSSFSSSLPTQSTRKRKRSQPQSVPSSLPINPLSHSPSLLSQFALAGLSETDSAPSSIYPDFPHRGLRRSPPAPTSATHADTDIDTEVDDGGDDISDPGPGENEAESKSGKKKQHENAQGSEGGISATVTTLTGSIHLFLAQGEIEKASRAFGLIVQLRPNGKPVDVRRYHLWALGAEILMRQGETPASPPSPRHQSLGHEPRGQDSIGSKRRQRDARWGSAVNMPRVRAYYESLMQQYPFDYRRPSLTSALDFWPALVSCELYNIDIERVIAMRKLELRGQDEEDKAGSSDGDTSSDDDSENQGGRLDKKKDAVRLRALLEMRDLVRRMDEVMADAPYSTNPRMLRLRAAAGMYISDLVRPLIPAESGSMNVERAEKEQEEELSKARACLAKVLESEATLSEAELAFLEEPHGGGERGQAPRGRKEKRKNRDNEPAGVDFRA